MHRTRCRRRDFRKSNALRRRPIQSLSPSPSDSSRSSIPGITEVALDFLAVNRRPRWIVRILDLGFLGFLGFRWLIGELERIEMIARSFGTALLAFDENNDFSILINNVWPSFASLGPATEPDENRELTLRASRRDLFASAAATMPITLGEREPLAWGVQRAPTALDISLWGNRERPFPSNFKSRFFRNLDPLNVPGHLKWYLRKLVHLLKNWYLRLYLCYLVDDTLLPFVATFYLCNNFWDFLSKNSYSFRPRCKASSSITGSYHK